MVSSNDCSLQCLRENWGNYIWNDGNKKHIHHKLSPEHIRNPMGFQKVRDLAWVA